VTVLRPIVNSWDVFDTLLTRFLPDPMGVFRIIEQRHAGFFKARLGAQAALDKVGKPYVLHDIYEHMAENGVGRAAARVLLGVELATERQMMFPIRATVDCVAASDLIISDMYLSGEQIASLIADICRLDARYPIIRSNWGKHSGTIWPVILRHYVLRAHYGDNPNADEAVPQKFGIRTVLLRDTELTAWEKSLVELGLTQLAYIQRETRLRSLSGAPDAFLEAACGPYLSLLLACAHQLRERYGEDRVFGFLSRDCDDLARVFRALYPAARALNVDLSRRLARDAAYDEVFGETLPEGCLLVDVVSTGRSVAGFLERVGRRGMMFTCVLWLDHLLAPGAQAGFEYVHRASAFEGTHTRLELLLQSPYPPVTALSYDAASGGLVRGFGQGELLAGEHRRIAMKSEMVSGFLRAIATRGLAPLTAGQSTELMRRGLEVILDADFAGVEFPSFFARELQAPF